MSKHYIYKRNDSLIVSVVIQEGAPIRLRPSHKDTNFYSADTLAPWLREPDPLGIPTLQLGITKIYLQLSGGTSTSLKGHRQKHAEQYVHMPQHLPKHGDADPVGSRHI